MEITWGIFVFSRHLETILWLDFAWQLIKESWFEERLEIQRVSMIPVIEQWFEEGNSIKQSHLQSFIKQLRRHRRYGHALQVFHYLTIHLHFSSAMPSPKTDRILEERFVAGPISQTVKLCNSIQNANKWSN